MFTGCDDTNGGSHLCLGVKLFSIIFLDLDLQSALKTELLVLCLHSFDFADSEYCTAILNGEKWETPPLGGGPQCQLTLETQQCLAVKKLGV